MPDDSEAVGFRVTGRVQGVNYRAWTRREAEALGLAGWVRNEPDGSVAGHLEGAPAAIERMLGRLREGPPAAAVRDVERRAAAPEGMRGFRVLR